MKIFVKNSFIVFFGQNKLIGWKLNCFVANSFLWFKIIFLISKFDYLGWKLNFLWKIFFLGWTFNNLVEKFTVLWKIRFLNFKLNLLIKIHPFHFSVKNRLFLIKNSNIWNKIYVICWKLVFFKRKFILLC